MYTQWQCICHSNASCMGICMVTMHQYFKQCMNIINNVYTVYVKTNEQRHLLNRSWLDSRESQWYLGHRCNTPSILQKWIWASQEHCCHRQLYISSLKTPAPTFPLTIPAIPPIICHFILLIQIDATLWYKHLHFVPPLHMNISMLHVTILCHFRKYHTR